MRCDFFMVPAAADSKAADDLNRLLSSARILTVDRHFVADGANSFWSVCVVSQTGGDRPQPGQKRAGVDYKDVLDQADFVVFARLREVRKELAARDGVPPYSIFTNEQLAEMARRRVSSLTAIREIAGVGQSRVEKYGQAVLDCLRAAEPDSSAAP